MFYNGRFDLSRAAIEADLPATRTQYLYNSMLVMATQCTRG